MRGWIRGWQRETGGGRWRGGAGVGEDTVRVNNPVESLGVRQTLRPKGLYSGGGGVLPLKLMERKRHGWGRDRLREAKQFRETYSQTYDKPIYTENRQAFRPTREDKNGKRK